MTRPVAGDAAATSEQDLFRARRLDQIITAPNVSSRKRSPAPSIVALFEDREISAKALGGLRLPLAALLFCTELTYCFQYGCANLFATFWRGQLEFLQAVDNDSGFEQHGRRFGKLQNY
jgi:hypothetical protein